MAVQVMDTPIGPDLTLQIAQIAQNHYSHDLHHYDETIINYNLQPNYTALVLYNMLKYPGYHLDVVLLAVI